MWPDCAACSSQVSTSAAVTALWLGSGHASCSSHHVSLQENSTRQSRRPPSQSHCSVLRGDGVWRRCVRSRGRAQSGELQTGGRRRLTGAPPLSLPPTPHVTRPSSLSGYFLQGLGYTQLTYTNKWVKSSEMAVGLQVLAQSNSSLSKWWVPLVSDGDKFDFKPMWWFLAGFL